MSQVKWVQSLFSLPGGMGNYLDTVYEFLVGLEPRATTRDDAFGWFQERFNAVKSAPYYLPVEAVGWARPVGPRLAAQRAGGRVERRKLAVPIGPTGPAVQGRDGSGQPGLFVPPQSTQAARGRILQAAQPSE